MSKKMQEAQEQAIRDHVNIDAKIRTLISTTNQDLRYGPLQEGDEGYDTYPGFVAACKQIAAALPHSDLWVYEDGPCVTDKEPDWWTADADDAEGLEEPELWTHYDSRDVIRALVGRELMEHVL